MFARFDTTLTANMCDGGDPVLFLSTDGTVLAKSARTFLDNGPELDGFVLFGKMSVPQAAGSHTARIMAGCSNSTAPLSTPTHYNVAFLTITAQ